MKQTMGYNLNTRLIIAFCIGILCFAVGCSKGSLLKEKGHDKEWTCSIDADNALEARDFKVAIPGHKKLLEKEPENGLAMYHLGYAYGQIEDYNKEIQYYEMAIDHGFFNSGIFFNLGMAYGEQDLIEKAISTFTRGIEITPTNSDNHFGLAMAYQNNKLNELAAAEFLKAIELDSENIEIRLQLGILYIEMNEIQKAKGQFKKALEINPGNIMIKELLDSIEAGE